MNRTLKLSVAVGLTVALVGFHELGHAAGDDSGRQSVRVAQTDLSSKRDLETEDAILPAVINDMAEAAIDCGQTIADVDRQLIERLATIAREQAADKLTAAERIGREFVVALTATPELSPGSSALADPALPPELQSLSGQDPRRAGDLQREALQYGPAFPWEIMHRMVAFGIPTEIRRDAPDGQRVNAIGWLFGAAGGMDSRCWCSPPGSRPGESGRASKGIPASSSACSPNQKSARKALSSCEGRSFTVEDLIEQEKLDCNTNMELTFKLIAFSYYVKSDETWLNQDKQQWSISRLFKRRFASRSAPPPAAALIGCWPEQRLSLPREARKTDRRRISAGTDLHPRLPTLHARHSAKPRRQLQHRLVQQARQTRPIRPRKLQTTGHMLEWLVWSLPEEQLRDPRVSRSSSFIATTLSERAQPRLGRRAAGACPARPGDLRQANSRPVRQQAGAIRQAHSTLHLEHSARRLVVGQDKRGPARTSSRPPGARPRPRPAPHDRRSARQRRQTAAPLTWGRHSCLPAGGQAFQPEDHRVSTMNQTTKAPRHQDLIRPLGVFVPWWFIRPSHPASRRFRRARGRARSPAARDCRCGDADCPVTAPRTVRPPLSTLPVHRRALR